MQFSALLLFFVPTQWKVGHFYFLGELHSRQKFLFPKLSQNQRYCGDHGRRWQVTAAQLWKPSSVFSLTILHLSMSLYTYSQKIPFGNFYYWWFAVGDHQLVAPVSVSIQHQHANGHRCNNGVRRGEMQIYAETTTRAEWFHLFNNCPKRKTAAFQVGGKLIGGEWLIVSVSMLSVYVNSIWQLLPETTPWGITQQ